MTIGQKRIDPLPVYVPSIGVQRLGRLYIKDWNGWDAVTSANPRSSYPLRPKVRGPRRKPILPDMPYWMHIEDSNLDGFWADTGVGLSYFNKNIAWGTGCANVSFDASNELKLISKLRERVYGSGFSPAVFAAEGRQALQLIGNSATRISSGLSRLRARDPWGLAEALGIEPRKGFIKGISDVRRTLSSLWLEVSYGWQPLLKDAEEGAKYLAAMLVEKVPAPIRVRKVWSETSSGTIADDYGSGFKGRVDIHELTLTMKNWSSAPVYRPNLYTVAEVAWEKLPYSFVFDWFVPVGSLLNALKTREDLSGTFIRTLKTTSVGTNWSVGPGFITPPIAHLGLPDKKVWVTLSRSVSSELQVPGIRQFISDDIATYKSWRHAANAVALLSQRKLSSVVGGKN